MDGEKGRREEGLTSGRRHDRESEGQNEGEKRAASYGRCQLGVDNETKRRRGGERERTG